MDDKISPHSPQLLNDNFPNWRRRHFLSPIRSCWVPFKPGHCVSSVGMCRLYSFIVFAFQFKYTLSACVCVPVSTKRNREQSNEQTHIRWLDWLCMIKMDCLGLGAYQFTTNRTELGIVWSRWMRQRHAYSLDFLLHKSTQRHGNAIQPLNRRKSS